ncbi:MAG: transcriptional regulator [Thermoproteota archaeon]
MNKDRMLGAVMFLGSIAVAILYFWLVFLSDWYLQVIKITAFLAVGFILFIMGWIGYTLTTTPPPQPIEEFEKQAPEKPPPPPDEKTKPHGAKLDLNEC